MNNIRKKRTWQSKEKITIGISGTDRGAGVTHLSIAIANYLCSVQQMKVAVVEMNGKEELGQLATSEDRAAYQIKGVTYYPAREPADFLWLAGEDFDCLILDLGSQMQETRTILAACQKKILVGSLQPWKVQHYEKYLEVMGKHDLAKREIVWLSLYEAKRMQKMLEHRYKIRIKAVPYLEDPFRIKQESFEFFQNLLET